MSIVVVLGGNFLKRNVSNVDAVLNKYMQADVEQSSFRNTSR